MFTSTICSSKRSQLVNEMSRLCTYEQKEFINKGRSLDDENTWSPDFPTQPI